jgi:hypothetical protein
MIPVFPLGEVKNSLGAGALRTAAKVPEHVPQGLPSSGGEKANPGAA